MIMHVCIGFGNISDILAILEGSFILTDLTDNSKIKCSL